MDQKKIKLKKTRARLTVQFAGDELSCVIEFLSEKQPSPHMQRESDEAYAYANFGNMIQYNVEILE